MTLLSGDPPRGRMLQILIVLIVVALALAPFLFPASRRSTSAAKTCVMILLVASYDVLLGYSGIVSFAHVMFFGVGAYGVGIALYALGPSMGRARPRARRRLRPVACAGLGGWPLLAESAVDLLRHGDACGRLRLQRARFAALLADGRARTGARSRFPTVLQPGFKWLDHPIFGAHANGKLLTYYLVFVVVSVAFLVLLRIVNSPFGRVLQAIRENPFRAEALGYRTVFHRTLATCIAALGATLAGALSALWLRYVGPDTALSFSIQVDVLVMVVVGGMGSLYGAIVGAALFVFAEAYLQDLMGELSRLAADARLPLLPAIFHPDRWLLWLGLAFVLAVYFAPLGIVGALKPVEGKAK